MEMMTHETAKWKAYDGPARPIPSPEQQLKNMINFELYTVMSERREFKRLASLLESRSDRYRTTVRRLIKSRMVRVCQDSLLK